MVKTFSMVFVLLCLMLDSHADAQSKYEFQLDGIRGEGLSNHNVIVDYYDDTTIVLACNIYRRGWAMTNDLVFDRKGSAYEYLKFVIDDRLKWFIKDYVTLPWAGKAYTSSPDKKTIIYTSRDKDINAVYQHNLVTRDRFLLNYPEHLWAFGHTWSPVDDIVWIEGGIIDPEKWIGREVLKESTISFNGPTYYLYFPSKKEFKYIFSADRMYLDPYADLMSVWTADGKAVFFKYTYYFGVYGRPDSAKAYGAKEYVDFLYKYDLEKDSVIFIYAGDELGGRILTDKLAYDTSIVICNYSHYTDEKNRKRSTVKQYISYNPDTKTSNIIWDVDDIKRPGKANTVFLSPNRKFVAYYTDDEFVIEVIGDTINPVIFSHPISLFDKKGSADFSDDSRKVCFTYKFEDKSELTGTRSDFGRWYFGWGEIIERRE